MKDQGLAACPKPAESSKPLPSGAPFGEAGADSSEGAGLHNRPRLLYHLVDIGMAKLTRTILERQIAARKKLWPEVTPRMLWDRKASDGFVTVPRVMPLMMSIMDDLSGKGFPVGQTYFEMWCRLFDELFLTLNRPEEMAFHAGFSGQRALRTWRDRVKRLADLGFIGLKEGPLGECSYAVFFNPYHVVKRHYLKGTVLQAKWQALIIRANEVGAFDFEDIDDQGNLIPPPSEDGDKTAGK